jgi:DNA mismatch endonuclease (patch repair protein)
METPMPDIMTPAQRSERMSRIRSRDTKPEMVVRSFLHGLGFRYRLHVRDLPGRPDLVLPKYGAVVFVEGCFWHGHSCQKGRVPGTNPTFWQAKVITNQARDRRNQRAIRLARHPGLGVPTGYQEGEDCNSCPTGKPNRRVTSRLFQIFRGHSDCNKII